MLRMAYVALVDDHVLGGLQTLSLDRDVTEDEFSHVNIPHDVTSYRVRLTQGQ